MRNWIHLAVALAAASAAAARAQQAPLPPPLPSQIVVVPESPPPPPPPPAQAPDGGSGSAVVVTDVPAGGDDAGTPVVAGESDAGAGEEIILLVPKKPPPPPEPPKQITVTVMHTPRPQVEWGQAGLELGISTGVYVGGSAVLILGELLPIVIANLFNARSVADGMLDVFTIANAVVLPLGTAIAIDKTKAYSRHYQLEGLGWWATFGVGVLLQGISAAITVPNTNVDNYYQAVPYIIGFGLLTPISQTVVAQVLATPRDPLAPMEGMARRPPVLLDGKGRPIPIVNVLSISF